MDCASHRLRASHGYTVFTVYKRSGKIGIIRWVSFPDRFVTAEDKIRELCGLVLAAPNDEAANRILPELRDAIHEHCERLRRKVATEYPFHKDGMTAD